MIIDTPPIAAVSDSFTLSSLVDKALYVIRWEQTPRNVALAGIRQLAEAGADIAGIVLSSTSRSTRVTATPFGLLPGQLPEMLIN